MKTQLVFIVLFSLLATSCRPTFYIPNTQNIPLIDSTSQTNLSLAGSIYNEYQGDLGRGYQFEFQGAYGLTRNLALQVNGGWVIPMDVDTVSGGSGLFIEGGVGYYKVISKKFLFEGYGLIRYGNLENHFPRTVTENPYTSGKISANLARIGIQPGLSFISKYFSITGSFRLANLRYSNIKGSLIFEDVNQVYLLTSNKSTYIFEPALTIKAGLKNLKIQLQLLKSWNLSNPDFPQGDQLLSIGLNYNFK